MIIFRADANSHIGMGHIMRCLSLADAFRLAGQKILFILSDDQVAGLVKEHGYEIFILNSVYTEMDAELELWPSVITDLIIVDSYYVSAPYLNNLQQKAKLVYLDDLASFAYPVDILVNYNAYGPYIDYHSLYKGKSIYEPYYILGPTYAPLRAMFRGIEKKKQKQEAENILISTGGSDPEHIALRLVQEKPEKRTYHILLGNMNPDKEAIKKLALENEKVIVHENVLDMKSLICNMDIAVSAAGSTLYEICACGVPLITYVLADNQIPGANAFEKLGLAMNLGDLRETNNPGRKILDTIEELAENYTKRVESGCLMQEMIDGFGADRIIKQII